MMVSSAAAEVLINDVLAEHFSEPSTLRKLRREREAAFHRFGHAVVQERGRGMHVDEIERTLSEFADE